MVPENDLQKAFKAISDKRSRLDLLWRYVNGNQPLRYSTEKLRDAFGQINVHFEQNWCAVVLDAVLDRLVLKGWDVEKKVLNDILDEIWSRLSISLDAYDVHRAALATGEGYLIAWKTNNDIEIYYNDPRLCHVFYDPERPKVKRFAAKWFRAEDGSHRMTLYYPDRLEHYTAPRKDTLISYKAFIPGAPPTEPNPYGEIPVFHFRSPGELSKILTLQDAVNKMLADMMVAAEFGAFMQRWIISTADPGDLKNAPRENWWIPAGDGSSQASSVGQFAATPLDNYLGAIDKLAGAIAIISRTPKHYMFNTGASLSGEALLAMEAPLTKKVKQYQERLGIVWQEVGCFILKLLEQKTEGVQAIWERAESVQPFTEAQSIQLEVASGIPLITVLRRRGWGQDEINSMLKDIAEERASRKTVAQETLSALRIGQEQSNEPTV